MIKRTIICKSCETACSIVIIKSNVDDEDLNIHYCPVCSVDIEDDYEEEVDEYE